MKLFAGLGNPGSKYAGHRHNIGFMAADAIARRHSFSPWSKKFSAEVAEGRLGGEKLLLVKPQTFMNLSGQAVGEVMRFFKLSPGDITVFYDELDLAPGKVRIKTGGGTGGHNGIKSLEAHCGKDFRRVRLGIGHPGDKARVNAHVLGDFAKADHAWRDALLDAVADHAGLLADDDEAGFMNKLALAVKPHLPSAESDDGKLKPAKSAAETAAKARAEADAPKAEPPTGGPMAEMLRKLLGK